MRKFLMLVVAALLIYIGSAIVAIFGLAKHVQRGNGPAIMARVDRLELRRSIVSQILNEYDEINEQQQNSRGKLLTQVVGGTIADAMVNQLLTAENITSVLKDGRIAPTDQTPEFSFNLSRISADDATDLLNRFRVSGIRRFAIRLSNETDRDARAELLMEFQGTAWRIVGLRLPRSILTEIANRLPKA